MQNIITLNNRLVLLENDRFSRAASINANLGQMCTLNDFVIPELQTISANAHTTKINKHVM